MFAITKSSRMQPKQNSFPPHKLCQFGLTEPVNRSLQPVKNWHFVRFFARWYGVLKILLVLTNEGDHTTGVHVLKSPSCTIILAFFQCSSKPTLFSSLVLVCLFQYDRFYLVMVVLGGCELRDFWSGAFQDLASWYI